MIVFRAGIEVELFDYVQMVALSGRDKLVKIVTPLNEGFIWFEHGDIVHAEFETHAGENAFYKLLAVGRGTFTEVFFTDPPKRTIMGSATGLLMEAARQMDEGTLGQDPVPAVPEHTDDPSSFMDLNEDVAGLHIVADVDEHLAHDAWRQWRDAGQGVLVVGDLAEC